MRRPGWSRKVISWTLSVLVVAAIAGGLLHARARVRPGARALADADPRGCRARAPPCCWRRTSCRTGIGGGRSCAASTSTGARPCGRRRWPSAGWRCGRSRRAGSGGSPARTRWPRCPVTQWLFDPVLALDPTAWRLRLPGRALDLDGARRPAADDRPRGDRLHGRLVGRGGVARGAARGSRAALGVGARRRVGDRLPAPPARVRRVGGAAGDPRGRRAAGGRARRPRPARRRRGGGGSGGSSGWWRSSRPTSRGGGSRRYPCSDRHITCSPT